MHQVRPALHHSRSEQANVPVDPRKLSLVHSLDEIAAGSPRGPFADFLVYLGQLLVGSEPLQHHASRALPGLAVLREVHVLDIENVQEPQATPGLKRNLTVHELAAPAGAEAGGTLIEVDESSVGQFILLEGGKQVVGVHQQDDGQPQH